MFKSFNWKAPFSRLGWRITNLYTGPAQKKAIAVTAVAVLSVTSVSASAIYNAINKPPAAYATSRPTEQITTVEETNTDALKAVPETTTVAETTTIPETTTVPPETTTVPPETTTVPPETSAEPVIDVPEIIPVENLEISPEDLSTQDEVLNRNEANNAPDLEPPEPVTEAPTQGGSSGGTVNVQPPNPSAATLVHGIDVSKYQGEINWTQVKNDGIDFAFIKVAGRGYGTGKLYYDTWYKENLKNASLAGVKVGAYFFSQAITVQEAVEEASMMIDALRGYDISYPVVFDWETSEGYRTNIGISKATMTAMADTFCSMLEAAGYKAMVYANTYDFERFDAAYLTSKYASWLARYTAAYKKNGVRYSAGNTLPSLKYPYQIWQYSSTGRVNGISGNVDMNIAFMDFYNPSSNVYPIKLEIPQTIHTCVGRAVNLRENVKCFNSAGIDCSSSVTVTLTDSSGNAVSAEQAFLKADTYKITYSVTDFTGKKASASATLYVEQTPVITLGQTELSVSRNTSYDELIALIENNLIHCVDFEGTDITNQVVISYPSDFYTEVEETTTENNEISTSSLSEADTSATAEDQSSTVQDMLHNITQNPSTQTAGRILVKKLTAGTYTVTYSVTDSHDYSSSVELILNITEEESTGIDSQ